MSPDLDRGRCTVSPLFSFAARPSSARARAPARAWRAVPRARVARFAPERGGRAAKKRTLPRHRRPPARSARSVITRDSTAEGESPKPQPSSAAPRSSRNGSGRSPASFKKLGRNVGSVNPEGASFVCRVRGRVSITRPTLSESAMHAASQWKGRGRSRWNAACRRGPTPVRSEHSERRRPGTQSRSRGHADGPERT